MPITDAAIEAAKPDQYRDLPLIVAAELRVTSDHDHRTWGEVKRALEVWRKIAAFHHLTAPAAGGLSEEERKTVDWLRDKVRFSKPGHEAPKLLAIIDRLAALPGKGSK